MLDNVITLPGLWNSGPLHWQTQWERKYPHWRRIVHSEWERPDCARWVAELDAAIAACDAPPLLAAHSLSCTLVSRWAMSGSRFKVAGAFLVGPSDVDAPSYPLGTTGFGPMPLAALPFPSLVVASSDDPYVSIERARQFAAAWGSQLVEIGNAGHINGDSGHGPWPEGEQLLQEFGARLR